MQNSIKIEQVDSCCKRRRNLIWQGGKTMKTHAQNKMTELTPQCYQTYCGKIAAKVTLAKDNEEPTCTLCKNHYQDPLRAKLAGAILELKGILNEFFTMQQWILDADGKLDRFVVMFGEFVKAENERQKQASATSLCSTSDITSDKNCQGCHKEKATYKVNGYRLCDKCKDSTSLDLSREKQHWE
jgi:hypothetical protein